MWRCYLALHLDNLRCRIVGARSSVLCNEVPNNGASYGAILTDLCKRRGGGVMMLLCFEIHRYLFVVGKNVGKG